MGLNEPMESPAPPPCRDVRVVTPEYLEELRRDQQEAYRTLRLRGFGPRQAAREVGIPRSLAASWEEADAAGAPFPPNAGDLSPRGLEILELRTVYRQACEAARRARAYTDQLERDVAAIREHLYRLESNGEAMGPKSAAPAPSRPEPPPGPAPGPYDPAPSSAPVELPAS